MRQVEIVQMNLQQYQIHKKISSKILKASPTACIFQRGFLVGLYSLPLIFERLNFQMSILRKKLGHGEDLLNKLRDKIKKI